MADGHGEASDDDSSAIFLDRDGDRFQLCLDYMRDGKVHLPFHISRDALVHELDYYGIAKLGTVDYYIIIDDSHASKESIQYMRYSLKNFKQGTMSEVQDLFHQRTTLAEKIQKLDNEIFAKVLVYECAVRYARFGMSDDEMYLNDTKKGDENMEFLFKALDNHPCREVAVADQIKGQRFDDTTKEIGEVVAKEFIKYGFAFDNFDVARKSIRFSKLKE